MEDEILDDFEIEETYEIGGPPVYANKSFGQFLFSIVVFVIINFMSEGMFHYIPYLNLIAILILSTVALGLNIWGMVNASKSERFQEKVSWKKYVGAIGNMLMFFPSLISFVAILFEMFFSHSSNF